MGKIKEGQYSITISITDDLIKKMNEYPEVNWSSVCRMGIDRYLKNRQNTE